MASSLFAGVAGLRAHQQMLDVVGNNLANVNTTGFKSQRVNFSDLLYQQIGTAPNPVQVGFGVQTASIETNTQQGSLETTGGQFDMALQGNGFFVVNGGTGPFYTRAGSFTVDQNGFLIDQATGFKVQRFGTVGEATATTPGFQTPGVSDIKIPVGGGIPGQATNTITLTGNLSANATGPLAQVLTSSSPFTVASAFGGGPATATTPLNQLTDNTNPYQAGDQIHLVGTTATGAAVNVNVPVDATFTLGQLVNAINTNFPGSTATLTPQGNLQITSNTTGTSQLSVGISDASTNVGTTAWGNHNLTITTAGKGGDTISSAIQFYDTQGTPHNLSLTFTKQGPNVWSLTGTIPASDGTVVKSTINGITFNPDGSFQQVAGTGAGGPTMTFNLNGGSSTPQTINFDFGTPNGFTGLTGFGGPSSAAATSQDGFAAGSLTSTAVTAQGVINGIFSNGRTLAIAQLAIANFASPGNLERVGNNYFTVSNSSGVPSIGGGLSGGRGSVQQGALEGSNIDTALEFTRLIVAQRGFQVNARTITVSNDVLQELANIVR
jgi:flagellar hook protein FlgE